jgi:hypothetical protein
MSHQAKKELLVQIVPRYREASRNEKTAILDASAASPASPSGTAILAVSGVGTSGSSTMLAAGLTGSSFLAPIGECVCGLVQLINRRKAGRTGSRCFSIADSILRLIVETGAGAQRPFSWRGDGQGSLLKGLDFH